jgi:hypothetical protein
VQDSATFTLKATPAEATSGSALKAIVMDDPQNPLSHRVEIQGQLFTPLEGVILQLHLPYYPLAPGSETMLSLPLQRANAQGKFSLVFTLDQRYPTGTYSLTATGSTSDAIAVAPFEIPPALVGATLIPTAMSMPTEPPTATPLPTLTVPTAMPVMTATVVAPPPITVLTPTPMGMLDNQGGDDDPNSSDPPAGLADVGSAHSTGYAPDAASEQADPSTGQAAASDPPASSPTLWDK